MNNPKELAQRFPYQFSGQNIGFGIYKGWYSVIERVCQDVDDLLGPDKRGFHWIQIKEKFGIVRMYWGIESVEEESELGSRESDPSNVAQERAQLVAKINMLIGTAEDATCKLCIVCGKLAKVGNFGGYIQVLCREHARMERAGCLPSPRFSEEES